MKKKLLTKKDFSCGGVVLDESAKKILLVKVENLSKKQVWTFPKGHPEKRETDEQAAVREVLEETGWACKVERPIMDVRYFYIREGTRFHKTVRWFLMSPIQKAGTFAEGEILDCKWFSKKEAEAVISYGSDKELLGALAL